MEIIFKEENGNVFGSTKIIGKGKRQPKLIYGEKAKKLRESANLTIDELAKEFEVRSNVISKIESQQASLDEKTMNKYIDKFNVNKEYFFDLELETLILGDNNLVLANFDTKEEMEKAFDNIIETYYEAIEGNASNIIIDFKTMKEGK